MAIIPIVFCTLDTVTKGLIKGLEDLERRGRVETVQNTALLRTARRLRRADETCEDVLSLKLQCWREKFNKKNKSKVGDLCRVGPKAPFQ